MQRCFPDGVTNEAICGQLKSNCSVERNISQRVSHLNDENSRNGEDIENPGRFLDSIFKVEEEKAKEAVENEEEGAKTHINLVKKCGVPGLKIGEWRWRCVFKS